eukprot:2028543-Prymnesium_polylepis.1
MEDVAWRYAHADGEKTLSHTMGGAMSDMTRRRPHRRRPTAAALTTSPRSRKTIPPRCDLSHPLSSALALASGCGSAHCGRPRPREAAPVSHVVQNAKGRNPGGQAAPMGASNLSTPRGVSAIGHQ